MLNPLRARASVRALNLALQGGGAHGAFTWGVLDRLVEEKSLRLSAVSGASAGAVNAVLLAAGLVEDGPRGAKAKLKRFWEGVCRHAAPGAVAAPMLGLGLDVDGIRGSLNGLLVDLASRVLSPYQVNPLDYNPLRELLDRLVDFARLGKDSPLALYVSATDMATGKARIFRTSEITRDVVLASACLPQVHHAVKIDDRYYWDGAYSANPPILPLVSERHADDTLVVQIIPQGERDLPTQAPEIVEQLNRIVFGEPLRRELRAIDQARRVASQGIPLTRRFARLRRHRFHHIDATPVTGALPPGSRLVPNRRLITTLHRAGREAATAWLAEHGRRVGSAATMDLAGFV